MKPRLVLNHREDWLLPGSPDDSRLFHADPSDQILVYPSSVGQGYRQKIRLNEDLTLVIMDYVINHDVLFDVPGETACTKFEFPLDTGPQYSEFIPVIGFRMLGTSRPKKRIFEVEVVFNHFSSLSYAKACLERFPPQTQRIVEGIVQSMWKFQGGRLGLDTDEMMDRLVKYTAKGAMVSYSDVTLGHLLSESLYSDAIDLQYANRRLITPAMEKILGQILSCPYHGAMRRKYLEQKALELVALRLQAIAKPRLKKDDLHCIYEAASILRNQIVQPPTVEMLARKVGTNRLKLNQGFHAVYGTTPFKYLRDCRLTQARRLLAISELSVEQVASAVGYSSRNHFAKAFRQQAGLNPKTFQMQAWQCAS
ncbi:MAG: helix-turn-helix transcriptional regulator [Cyanobacteria bacterium P01_C01_bin.118]